jgi:very-short-patch-repair endonuclease
MAKNNYASRHMIDRSRGPRRTATPPKALLWTAVRNGQIGGLKFRRQHPTGPYLVDFFCESASLVVEVDGISHDQKMTTDAARTTFLEQDGLRILRVTNDDVMRDLDAVTREIASLCNVPWD